MVLIYRNIAGVAIGNMSGLVRESVPNRGFAPVFMGGAFYLVGGGGAAPEEGIREAVGILGIGFRLGWGW